MNGGPSSYFKPPEPDGNKGGFRKIKRGEGQASAWGAQKTGNGEMRLWGWIILGVASGVPTFASLFFWTDQEALIAMMVACLFMTHLLVLKVGSVTGRSIPRRGWALGLAWAGIVFFLILR